MNKKLIAITVISALALGAFAVYGLVRAPAEIDDQATVNAPSSDTDTADQSSSPPQIPEAGTEAMGELLQVDADIECSYTYQDSESGQSITGTLFHSGAELRVDSLLEDAEFGQYVSSLILTSDTVYLWSDIGGQTYGVEADRTADGATVDKINAPIGLNDVIEYECESWEGVDRSVFLPPGEVLFQDFGATQQSGMEYGTIYEESSTPLPVTSSANQE